MPVEPHGPVENFAANPKLRKWRTYSQEFRSERRGVHPSEISRRQKGERAPRLTTISKLAKGRYVDIATLPEHALE